MPDLFLDRVAQLSGLTVRRLREHQRMLFQIGLTDEAMSLEPLIREHEEVVVACNEDTDVGRQKTTSRGIPKR